MNQTAKSTSTEKRKSTKLKIETFLPADYQPSDDEPFMNDNQTEYFRVKLLNWKADLLEDSRDTVAGMKDQTRKIPAALRRIDEGEFGYCSITGEQISLKRLDARPIATMSLEAQERHERREKVHRDD